MIYRKYSQATIILLIILIVLSISVYADDTWLYKIIEKGINSTEEMVDLNNSSVEIDHVKKEIRLQKMPLPNVADFTPNGAYNYALLKDDGIHQYVFDGEELVEIGKLKTEMNNPLSLAVAPYPYNITVSMATDSNSNEVMHYTLEQGGMANNPLLNMTGLQQIYSMTTFKDSGELAVLGKNELNIYASEADRLVPISEFKITDIKNPIAVATASNYNFALMDREKIAWYSYDGSNMVQIPAMSIAFDENIKNPKGLAIKNDTIYFLHDEKITTYEYNKETKVIEQNIALSITSGLIKPHAIALRSDNSDLIIIDEIDSVAKDFKIRYMMYDGNKLVENETLSQVLKGVMAGLRYYGDGELIMNMKTAKAAYADYIRIRAYTEVPKDTQITFYMANEGVDYENAVWHETWRVKNTEGTPIVEKAILSNTGTREWKHYGAIGNSYPTFDTMTDTDDGIFNDDDLLIEEIDGSLNIEIVKERNNLLNLWNVIPVLNEGKKDGRYRNIRVKAVLKTNDPEITPRIYVPTGTNNESGLTDIEGRAIVWEANAIPEPPVILPIKPGHGDEENYEPIPGWIYTTTPDIEWDYKDADKDVNPEHKQTAYQIILLKKDIDGKWSIAFNSRKIKEENGEETTIYSIPTSYNPNIAGPMWMADSCEFAVAVRTWDKADAISRFSSASRFKVLAFERPRISNIVNPPDDGSKGVMTAPTSGDTSTHYMITPGMKKESLPLAKAGAQVTMLIDSVGPIETLPEEISSIYFIYNNETEIRVDMGKCKALYESGLSDVKNRFMINFWTKAPITEIPNDTLIMVKFVGTSQIGGTTVFYIPTYADGVVVTKDTIYEDWHVVLEGSDK